MKRRLLLIIILVIAAFTTAQNENKIVFGKTGTIFSKLVNEKRRILVCTQNFTPPVILPN